MGKVMALIKNALNNVQRSLHPLHKRFILLGIWIALICGVLFQSVLAGFSFLVLFLAMKALWPRHESPILAFCIAFQWIFVVTGYLYRQAVGIYPGMVTLGMSTLGNLEGAVFLSLIGLLVLVAGIRIGAFSLKPFTFLKQRKLQSLTYNYNVQLLFWIVIAIYAIGWFVEIFPMGIAFNIAQIISGVLEFRAVFLFLLFLVIIQKRKGYLYGVVALLFVLIPLFTSVMSAFRMVFTLLLIALLAEWRPWSKFQTEIRRSDRVAWATALTIVALVVMSVFWTGVAKPFWRPAVVTGEIEGMPTEKITAFASLAQEVAPEVNWNRALEGLASRLSSSIAYFSCVLDRVPKIVPHENGKLTLRALEHVSKPRFLFQINPTLAVILGLPGNMLA